MHDHLAQVEFAEHRGFRVEKIRFALSEGHSECVQFSGAAMRSGTINKEDTMPNEQEKDPKLTAKDTAIEDRVQELRSELEKLGRWEIVTWCDEDIVTALEHSGAN